MKKGNLNFEEIFAASDRRLAEKKAFNQLLQSYRNRAKREGKRIVYFPYGKEIYSFEPTTPPPNGEVVHSIADKNHCIKIRIDVWLEYAEQIPITWITHFEKFHFQFPKTVELKPAKDALFNMHYLCIDGENVGIAYTEQNGHKHWKSIGIPQSIYLEWKKVMTYEFKAVQLKLLETKIYHFEPIGSVKANERIHLTVDEKTALCGLKKSFTNYTLFTYDKNDLGADCCIKCAKIAKKLLK